MPTAAPPDVPRWKRALDITCLVLAFPLLLPCMLLIALLIKIVSPGPVLFTQVRVGYRGGRFKCFKFRSMTVGADTTGHQGHFSTLVGSKLPMVKLDMHGDSRLIPLGLPLRTSGLDELPQILNVLRGEMSLVGPRPCLPYEYDQYLPAQRERFNTLPGLTGLWQVSGKNRTTFDEMIRLDVRYSRTKSLWMDIGIILRTVPALMVQMMDTLRARMRPGSLPAIKDGQPSREHSLQSFGNGLAHYSSKATVESTLGREI